MADFRCEPCGNMCFKTNQAFQRHIQTNKHKLSQTCTREDLLQCIKCNKWYCGKSGLYHHKKTCASSRLTPVPVISVPVVPAPQSKLGKIEEIMERKMDEMKLAFEKERQEMKHAFEEAMKDQINKILEQHASATTTNHNTNSNNTSQNIETLHNITNININAFGNENTDYIDEKVILSCINRVFKSIPSLLEKLHFDPEHPENHNIKITNKKLPYASVMGNNQKWKTVDRKNAVESMVQKGYNLLDDTYADNKNKFSSIKQQNFEGFQSKFEAEDKELVRQIKTEVEMMVLNGAGGT